jgi:hypothetical protein
VVARAAASINTLLPSDGEATGTVGFYESVPDEEPARAVLSAAIRWLREKNVRRVLGPVNLGIFNGYRLMTRGFETTPYVGEPRNPPYYVDQLAAVGFVPLQRYYAWDNTLEHLRVIRDAAAAVPSPSFEDDFEIRDIDLSRFEEELRALYPLVAEGFVAHAGWYPLPLEEYLSLYMPLRPFVVSEMAQIVCTRDGRPTMLGLVCPDLIVPSRLIFHTVVVEKTARKRGLLERALARVLDAALARGLTSGVNTPVKEGPYFATKTSSPSREYTLYELRG